MKTIDQPRDKRSWQAAARVWETYNSEAAAQVSGHDLRIFLDEFVFKPHERARLRCRDGEGTELYRSQGMARYIDDLIEVLNKSKEVATKP